jgi:DNA-binding MarR family transcriptional regulator
VRLTAAAHMRANAHVRTTDPATDRPDALAGPDECACLSLRQAARVVTQLYDEALAPAGIRSTQFSLLSAIAWMQPVSMNDLAARMVMDRTTLTRNLRPVLDAGLVTVRTGDDRRRREVALTRAGSRTLDEATGYWRAAQAEMRQALGDRRLASLRDHLAETVSRVGELSAR